MCTSIFKQDYFVFKNDFELKVKIIKKERIKSKAKEKRKNIFCFNNLRAFGKN